MHFLYILLSIALFASSSVIFGASFPDGLNIKRMTHAERSAAGELAFSKMHFKGTIGGHTVDFQGTVEEILDHVEAQNPGFDRTSLLSSKNSTAATRDLQRRNKAQTYCCPVAGQNWNYAYASRIGDGIDYLNNFRGVCNVGPGPGNCVRVSCSYSSGIHLCNDDHVNELVLNCGWVASFAEDLINDCSQYPPFGNQLVCGQEFDTDNYNVFVCADSC